MIDCATVASLIISYGAVVDKGIVLVPRSFVQTLTIEQNLAYRFYAKRCKIIWKIAENK